MSFLPPAPPRFGLDEWGATPYLSRRLRLKANGNDWAVNGFGSLGDIGHRWSESITQPVTA